LNLSLGLIGFLTLDSFKSSINSNLESKSKAILGADLSLAVQRDLTEQEEVLLKKALPLNTVERRELGMFSMASTGTKSRLAFLIGIDKDFPYYGALTLKNQGEVSRFTSKSVVTKPVAWLYPELQTQLGVKVGEKIKFGNKWFTVEDIVTEDPSVSTVSFVPIAKIYVGLPFVADTGLLKTGSRVYYSRLYKLPPDQNASEIKGNIKKVLTNTDIMVTSHEKASPEFGRILTNLNDYLGLVSLVALFLAGVGSAFLFRSHLSKRIGDIAILLSLGVHSSVARMVYALHLVFLGSIATILTTLICIFLLPALPGIMGGLIGEGYNLTIPLKSILLTGVLGIGGSLLFCYPLLNRIKKLNPSALFQEDSAPSFDVSKRQWLNFIPVIMVYWLLAVFQSSSLLVGSLFVAIFTVCCALFSITCWLLMKSIERGSLRGNLILRIAALNIARHKTATLACFLAISLSAMLINIIPQIRDVVNEELSSPDSAPPSLFLFDIQDEQVDPLKKLISGTNASLSHLSPLIHARLTKLNGEVVKADRQSKDAKTREQERANAMRNRTFNLSFRAELASSEVILEGRPFSGAYNWDKGGPAEISVETRFADRLNLELGSIMEFDIGGVLVEAVVVNLRRVKWTSFHPNFFIQFQTGILDDAPKTFVASIPELPFKTKMSIQNKIVNKFGNISIVDVTKTINRILDLITKLTKAISFMAYLTLLAGLAVLFSIAGHQAQSRKKDTVLLKVLGTSFSSIKKIVFLEFTFLGLAASMLGAIISIGVSYILATVLFNGSWVFSWSTPAASILVITSLCIFTGYIATARSLQKEANSILN
jgi:putative ABC transport system permease protein